MRAAPLPLLADIRVRDFRCIGDADLSFDPDLNVLAGANGAGKTSFLEAIYFLGRGRSFRAADNRVLVRSGQSAAEIGGHLDSQPAGIFLGVRIAAGGLDIHVGGQAGCGPADLASHFAVQAIDADISSLGQGPPEARRRLLDWGVFHVKHDFLRSWRSFRRALAQRNAALRDQAADAVLAAWEVELAISGEAVDASRQAYLAELTPRFQDIGERLLGAAVSLDYSPGWTDGLPLAEALAGSRAADRLAGYTRVGPQRADLRFEIDAERSRWRASKGQQKLLGASLVLAQADLAAVRGKPESALVVDEPAADLDGERLAALIRALEAAPAQVFLACINPRELPLSRPGKLFHVEHGNAKALL